MSVARAPAEDRRYVGPTLFWQTIRPRIGEAFSTRFGRFRVLQFEAYAGGFLVVVEDADERRAETRR